MSNKLLDYSPPDWAKSLQNIPKFKVEVSCFCFHCLHVNIFRNMFKDLFIYMYIALWFYTFNTFFDCNTLIYVVSWNLRVYYYWSCFSHIPQSYVVWEQFCTGCNRQVLFSINVTCMVIFVVFGLIYFFSIFLICWIQKSMLDSWQIAF